MKSILFYDPVSPRPYNKSTLAVEPMGGTEATVIRVSQAFPLSSAISAEMLSGFDIVITLRAPGNYKLAKETAPESRHILWLHDYISGEYRQSLIKMLNSTKDAEVILVSDFHKHNFIDQLKDHVDLSKVKMHRIYNPVTTDGIGPGEVDKNKLIFFSSPHKGIEDALRLFSMIRRMDPEMKLIVANPGYALDHGEFPEGVTNLGSLLHTDMIKELSTALALFYPNRVFPETFGIVMAEANALGVPVLTHPLGAANEVLSHPKETMDTRDYKAVVNRILAWKKGDRPTVKADPRFTLEAVIKQWEKILC